jgi:hypothetical protein
MEIFALRLNFCFIHLQGDLHQYLKDKGALSPSTAINFSMDIARYGIVTFLSFLSVSYKIKINYFE